METDTESETRFDKLRLARERNTRDALIKSKSKYEKFNVSSGVCGPAGRNDIKDNAHFLCFLINDICVF